MTEPPFQEKGDTRPGDGFPQVALVWPGPYRLGMSSLGFLAARQLFLSAGCRVERFFADLSGSIETGRSLFDFDLAAFSFSFELDYLALLQILEREGFPPLAQERANPLPLVLAGGIALRVNRLPLLPFVDLNALGDGERLIPNLVDALGRFPRYRRNLSERKALLERLKQVEGMEVSPGAAEAAGLAEKAGALSKVDLETGKIVGAPPQAPSPALCPGLPEKPLVSNLTSPDAELGERLLVEISRGCPHRCTFCWLGQNSGSFLSHAAPALLDSIGQAAEQSGCKKVGLISASVGAHPGIDALCEGLMAEGYSLSFSSLRAEECRDSMLAALAQSGQKGLTLAPETADSASRARLGKAIPDSVFWNTLERAGKHGLDEMKLYFMVGLPEETDEVLETLPAFVEQARRILLRSGRRKGSLPPLQVNLGCYVPKPGTPLSHNKPATYSDARRRLKKITQKLAAQPNVKVQAASPDLALAQRLLSTGGPESAAFLYRVWKQGGRWREESRQERKKRGW